MEAKTSNKEDHTNTTNQHRKRGRPKKLVTHPSVTNKDKNHALSCREEVEVERSTSLGREVDTEEETTVSSPLKVRKRRRKGAPRQAAV